MSDISTQLKKLVIASGNAGKIKEFRDYLADLGVTLILKPDSIDVEETGATFIENAHLKASQVAIATGEWAIADDSGLEVIALNGAPGVLSARYADTDSDRINRVLSELKDQANREAQFVCAIAIASPDGAIAADALGLCKGAIADAPIGNGGFGYDPIFLIPEFQQTFGEIPPEVKAKISHRAEALAILRDKLQHLTK
ncbi:MAG: RdgB/HAM1 family non-canonical purine NTP pyrophosphatase [Pseudanabaena sp.]|jgi:XTP/dITP diphosphohydrolase|nr:RdgB/HAM1 family non-canonical purine NTP pyrophosphatase [Pseudanabaena sp. M090S1SP2A07QC]MCA6507291.1 RdgB/HAM1 family non-canonical purine NTP pyrophosphatase [Pseudanabaena sp. M172S2SP2A07QC]MCA6510359.1 RdgB/HAM1 family non-canonical purine NTP pyrophosphatase [Pseudanabaena sp. M109S1SP2A07QC]MCA6520726.1 RdgB/HAM1 family non-canonical purine NTP pyrophosphatase [Pseudanabaena sp. M051S1SP2A07QC]MCA6527127.1 RdgB/HAM1 family non-canonical purine NTP pyrophosphatase [Pseudanabaena sp.